MDPQLHLKLHNARVEESLRGRHQSLAQRPRPPGQSRRQVAEVLRRLADRVEAPAGQPRHA